MEHMQMVSFICSFYLFSHKDTLSLGFEYEISIIDDICGKLVYHLFCKKKYIFSKGF